MFKFLLLMLFPIFNMCGYEGKEVVDAFFSNLKNPNSPTYNEYREIENFLNHGERKYLKPLLKFEYVGRSRKDLMLVGSNKEMPTRDLIYCHSEPTDLRRCIIIYASYNRQYPDKARALANNLYKCGYRGHILLRIGGYPNLEDGGIHLCHIPYSFKVAAFVEAKRLGYENVMWVDTSLHPLNDLESLFQNLEANKSFFVSGGVSLDYADSFGLHLPNALNSLNVKSEDLSKIPHITAILIGMNFTDPVVNSLLDQWIYETECVDPCITLYPEELLFSVLCYKNGCNSLQDVGLLMCTDENKHLQKIFPSWCFYRDGWR